MLPRRALAKPAVLLAVLAGVGTAALLLTAEPVHAPARQRPPVMPGGLDPVAAR